MGDPCEFVLRDVRCFQGEQRGKLSPITLLVGENSSGKTTFLAAYSALMSFFSSPYSFRLSLDFNDEPFSMGSFRDIVRSRRGPRGRIDEFKLGVVVESSDDGIPKHEVSVTFGERGSQPVVTSIHYDFGNMVFLSFRQDDSDPEKTVIGTQNDQASIEFPFDNALYLAHVLTSGPDERKQTIRRWPELRSMVEDLEESIANGKPAVRKRLRRRVYGLTPAQRLLSAAPLRSKPKRTYDPVRETASPEGEHIPMLMMRLDRTDKRGWKSLHENLAAFGSEAGLFSDIKVKRHGRQMSDPFQLQIKVHSSSHANIMDVGYGVSQSLPILVDALSNKDYTFLLQQPEVHLHPRGQAELASLFLESVKKRRNRFLIETHSDYIIDRIRIAVRNGNFSAEDVSIIYFEPKSNAVDIYNLALDEHGNLMNAPAGYRSFFLKETDKLLGFAD